MLKILIAVDGSEHARRAIDAVGKMARSSLELEATLMCVSPEPLFYGDYTAATIQQVEDEQRKHQEEILARATDQAISQGLTLTEPARAFGVIANEIVRRATEQQVDQIAMGTRGMGAIANAMLGSVAQRVLHQATMPVLLVK